MAVRADILEIARVLQDASRCAQLPRFVAPSPLGGDAQVYASLMKELPRHRDVPGALKDAAFQPCFLVNGLIIAAAMPRSPRSVLLESLAAGLLEFTDYFERLAAPPSAEPPPLPDARRAQARYFAYCAAQLVECGMPLTAALTTMKGDALEPEVAYEIRGWIEDGPDAMLASSLLSEAEKPLWRAVFAQGRAAWPALREHLVAAYSLPFRRLPER